MPIRYLTCLLVCEGVSDRWFLAELLRRALDSMCSVRCRHVVEVEIDYVLADHQRPANILDALGSVGRFDLLLYHHDGAPPMVSQTKVAEVCSSLAEYRSELVLPVVPIRETEAWMLADPEAVAGLCGVQAGRVIEAGVPARAGDVESIRDPKQLLKSVLCETARAHNGSRIPREDLFRRLGETVDLDRLREVQSFARWWSDMTEALVEMGYKQ